MKDKFQSPATEADLETPEVLAGLERIKNHFRGVVQEIFRTADEADRQADQARHQEMLNQMRKNQQPHEMGTVAEIAAKYGISKSEVRRRKADGTLEALKLMDSQ
jgi:DNA invertase Pin-like site-specific DNA recombinase